MTIYKRTWILTLLITVGFFSALAIPRSGETTLSWLKSKLPESLDNRIGERLKVSEKELEILAKDTTFERQLYRDQTYRDGKLDPDLHVSIVFSGKDINNSIHRPEVCLVAQGWNIVSSKSVSIAVDLPTGKYVNFTELVSKRPRVKIVKDDLGNEIDRETITDVSVQYYTFVGSQKIVAGHYERTWEDIRTRVMKGHDQQWAYMTVSASVMSAYVDQGYNIGNLNSLNVNETKEMLKSFIANTLPSMLEI